MCQKFQHGRCYCFGQISHLDTDKLHEKQLTQNDVEYKMNDWMNEQMTSFNLVYRNMLKIKSAAKWR